MLTLRAARLLARADIVFHDALVHPDTLALAAHAVKVAVGKRSGKLSTAQRFINKQLIDAARKYQTVVRLKGGDPMLFGRAQEEIDALVQAGITLNIVPGVSAAFAASAELQCSLTRRALSRSVVFAHGVPSTRPALIVENAASGEPTQRQVMATTVGQLPAAARDVGDGPALVMIGEVYAGAMSTTSATVEITVLGAISR